MRPSRFPLVTDAVLAEALRQLLPIAAETSVPSWTAWRAHSRALTILEMWCRQDRKRFKLLEGPLPPPCGFINGSQELWDDNDKSDRGSQTLIRRPKGKDTPRSAATRTSGSETKKLMRREEIESLFDFVLDFYVITPISETEAICEGVAKIKTKTGYRTKYIRFIDDRPKKIEEGNLEESKIDFDPDIPF